MRRYKFPRKLKKKIKKQIPKAFLNWEHIWYKLFKDYIEVDNSVIYLNNPTRKELSLWWNTYYPNSKKAFIATNTNFFKRLPKHKENYLKYCKTTGQNINY